METVITTKSLLDLQTVNKTDVIYKSVVNLLSSIMGENKEPPRQFPEHFKFGVATSSYQIEGAWDKDDKCESMWDYHAHTFPDNIKCRHNADVACDSYNRIDEDVQNIKDLRVQFYRFSISWCRILPTGFANEISKSGVTYYNNLIDKLMENGIEPIITIYHWELPHVLELMGGWTNNKITDYFVDFARICFHLFGDRVKTWITINEPFQVAEFGYGVGMLAPFNKLQGVGSYLAGHNVLIAHAKVYHMYHQDFAAYQKGRVGITIESPWCEPFTSSEEDKNAAERVMQMWFGWFAHPIFSKTGDYPPVMRRQIDRLSKEQGFPHSRLPYFTSEEIELIHGSSDFLGLNHYATFYVTNKTVGPVPSNANDRSAHNFVDENWKASARPEFKVVPWGLRKVLNWIKNAYGNPEVIITENGYSTKEDEFIDDPDRADYFKLYIKEVLKAVLDDNCNVAAYTAWTLLDNLEWSDGYTMRFGLYHVDFKDPNLKRRPKKSAHVYRKIVETRRVSDEELNI